MGISLLPPPPPDQVLREALPWWTRRVMDEAWKLGLQSRAFKVLKEVWDQQQDVPWVHPEHGTAAIYLDPNGEPVAAGWLGLAEPPEYFVLEEFQAWAMLVVSDHTAFFTWRDLSEILPISLRS